MFTKLDLVQHAGKDADEVVAHFQRTLPAFTVNKLPLGSFVTMDIRPNRIRVYHDEDNRVVSVKNG